jgi:hypothetical protein
MKTIAEILKTANPGDTLIAGKRKWKVKVNIFTGPKDVYASPANKLTTFELWTCGVESVAVMPGLKVVKSED